MIAALTTCTTNAAYQADVPSRIDPTRPAGPQIITVLRADILRMDLPPGCRLSESAIADRFGASRTPVREAFTALRDENLLRTFASRGTFVTRLDAHRIREAQFLREAIELATVRRLASTGLSPELRERAQANLDAQRDAIEADDDRSFQHLDDALHLLLAAATGHARVATVLAREKAQLDRLRALTLRDEAHMRQLLDEHTKLIEAIETRDERAALATAHAHLRSILEVLSSMIDRHAGFFVVDAST